MAVQVIKESNAEVAKVAGVDSQVKGDLDTSKGSAGLDSQVPGQPATVSGLASATGGIGSGNFVQPDLDEELFKFQSDDTPLMQLMLKAKKVKVKSPEVKHYMIDEPAYYVTTSSAFTAAATVQGVLPLVTNDQQIPRPFTTLLVNGVDGYDETGTVTPGKPLMLFVVDHDASTGNPIVRAINGTKANASDEFCGIPAIPAGTKCTILGNALYETQKEVDPDLIVPQPSLIYLQKRGMNQVVSDYFDAQKKEIPFTKSVIAEAAIANFKTRGNRTLWASRQGKFKLNVPKMGLQLVYATEGVRWQFKRELQHSGAWTVEKLIALAKMFFTGEDVPKTGIVLAGKNFLEGIQCIDYSKHPEIQISTAINPVGWEVTRIHTVFGNFDIKREPTLDRLGWSNSAGIFGEDRLVHYTYSAEHSFNDRVDGEEATRTGILIWDALALKGSCHIWVDGEEGNESGNAGAVTFEFWDNSKDPSDVGDVSDGVAYYFLDDTVLDSTNDVTAVAGSIWIATVTTSGGSSTVTWKEYNGLLNA